jgi:hypothetical protein
MVVCSVGDMFVSPWRLGAFAGPRGVVLRVVEVVELAGGELLPGSLVTRQVEVFPDTAAMLAPTSVSVIASEGLIGAITGQVAVSHSHVVGGAVFLGEAITLNEIGSPTGGNSPMMLTP